MPRDILLYVGWCKDIAAFWRFIEYSFSQMSQADLLSSSGRQTEEVTKGMKDGLAKLDSFLGVSVEKDILPALGDDFGFIVANLENTKINMLGPQTVSRGPMPGSFSIALPQIYTYLELKDVPKIRAILEDAVGKLVEKANLQIK